MAFSEVSSDQIEQALSELVALPMIVPPGLAEAMRYCLLAPGKRLRPRLVLLACAAAGGEAPAALPGAAAVEMVHTYSLVHDDLPAMDDDDLRRGRPTCHKAYGEAMAILAGDALLTLAFQVLAEKYPGDIAAACCRELALGAGAGGMVGGQALDLFWENRHDGGIQELESVHAGKTGALFRACLRIGGRVALAKEPVIAALDEFGRCFGLMFQVTDDLLDVNGSSATAGKRVGKDADRGKLTYPGLLGVDESRRRAEDLCAQAVTAVEPLGPAAVPLRDLARTVCTRDR